MKNKQPADKSARQANAINPALAQFDNLPDAAEVRAPTVAALNGVSIVTVWRWSKSGNLPAPTKRGGVTTWNVGALRRNRASSEV